MLSHSIRRHARYALIAAAPLAFVACDDDDPNEDNLGVDTLREVLRGSDYGELEDRLDEYDDLTDVLDDASRSLTLFAPTDAALDAINIDSFDADDREDVFRYHLVDTVLRASSIPTGYTVTNTLLTGTGPADTDLSLVILNDAGSVSVNGVNVIAADADLVDNGVIHTVNGVLTPPSIADFVIGLDEFSALEEALLSVSDPASTDLVGLLDGDTEYTVFAPLNSGLSIPDSLSDAENLTSILSYHVVPGFTLSSAIGDSVDVVTANGASLSLLRDADGGVSVTDESGNTATVVLADIVATNGVIHAIDGVLLPDDED